jgi:hypothetical protein
MNTGSSNRLIYDSCAYKKELYESTSPLQYRLYEGKYENCERCKFDKSWRPFDTEIVDVESELRNINKPISNCDEFMYNPNCKKSGMCTSTFDKTNPVIWSPELCPIVFNNIKKPNNPGYTMPGGLVCPDRVTIQAAQAAVVNK